MESSILFLSVAHVWGFSSEGFDLHHASLSNQRAESFNGTSGRNLASHPKTRCNLIRINGGGVSFS
jgi:hypothetical protein